MRVIQAIHAPPLPCEVFSLRYPPSQFFREPQLLVVQVRYSVLWRKFSCVLYIVVKFGLLCVCNIINIIYNNIFSSENFIISVS